MEAGRESGGEGGRAPARPLLGRIRGHDADLHADGQAGVAGRRQMPGLSGSVRRDYPLRANEKVVYTAYKRSTINVHCAHSMRMTPNSSRISLILPDFNRVAKCTS